MRTQKVQTNFLLIMLTFDGRELDLNRKCQSVQVPQFQAVSRVF